MSFLQKPEWINKGRLRRHVQMAVWATASFLMAAGMIILVADEDSPLWRKALAGVVGAVLVVAMIAAGLWLVYVWGRRPW